MIVRILAYFVPFAINFLSGGFFFIASYRFAQAECSRVIVSGSIAAWGIAYCLMTAIVGRIVSGANALRLILTGGVLLSLTSVGFLIFNGLYTQFIWLVLAGIGAAFFCTPFQLLAKEIESGGKNSGTVSATAFYTLTWSSGLASGPLAFARFTPEHGFMITLALALAVTASVIIISLLRAGGKSSGVQAADEVSKPDLISEKGRTRLAYLGWIVGGLGTVTVCQIRALWPKIGSELHIEQHHIAYILALVSYSQALTALALCRSKSWMWRRLPALLMSVCGIVSLLGFVLVSRVEFFYMLAVIYGIYSGSFYFYLVYHSLSHPTRSGFFVTGNEIIVGITSIAAPLLGGLLADWSGKTGTAFVFAAGITLAAFIAQIVMLNPAKLAEEK